MQTNKAPIFILFACLLTVMLGFGVILPLLPFYITHFGATGSALGFLMAVYSLMQFIFAPFWGQLSDKIGRKPVLMVGVLGYAIAFALMAFAQNYTMLVGARALAGILSSATLPTAMAYIADTTAAKDRSQGVGMMGAAMGLGMIFGPTLGGVLTGVHLPLPEAIQALMQSMIDPSTGELISLSVPFLFSALLAFLTLPIIFFALPESLTPERRGKAQAGEGSRLRQLFGALSGTSGFLFALAFVLTFALANLESILGLYGKESFRMGPAEIGMLMGAMGVLGVIIQGGLIGPLTRKFGEIALLKTGLLVSAVGFVGLALIATKAGMIASALVFNLGSTLLTPSVTSLISQRTPAAEQGTAMGFNNSFQSLGRTVGPLWAGFAFDVHQSLSFWTGAVVELAAFFYALHRLGSRKEQSAAECARAE